MASAPTDCLRTARSDRRIAAGIVVWATVVPIAGAALLWATHATWLPALRATGEMATFWLTMGAALATGLSLLPSHVAALTCGYVAGPTLGPCLALLAVGAAAILGYGLAQPVISERTLRLLARYPRAQRWHGALSQQPRGEWITLVALLRLSPVMPFALTNFVMAAARVPFLAFQAGSTLGMTPRVVAVAYAGAGLSELTGERTAGTGSLVAGVLATLLAAYWIGRMAQRALRQRCDPSLVQTR